MESTKKLINEVPVTSALQSAPDQIPAMIERAISNGIEASYVLMDMVYSTTSDSGNRRTSA